MDTLTDYRYTSNDADPIEEEIIEAWERFVIFGYVMRLPRVQTVDA